jgi:hypothetical protein
VAAINADPGQTCPAAPGVILGGAVLPAPIAAQAVIHATITDIDHTIPRPYGPTCASNLKCLCREHHFEKTLRDRADRVIDPVRRMRRRDGRDFGISIG